MARGAFFATIGLVLGATWHALYLPEVSLLFVPIIWAVTLMFTLPVMLLLSAGLHPILRLIHRRIEGGRFFALAVLAALPFVSLAHVALWALSGSPRISWDLSEILPLARMVLGATLGLGLGCAQDVLPDIPVPLRTLRRPNARAMRAQP